MTYLVCGEALFDCFLDDEDSPDRVRFEARVGGSPFNVAIGVARLGGRVALLAGLSTDLFGERLLSVLESEGVDTCYLVRSDHPTPLSFVGVDAAGQPRYAFYGSGAADRCVTPAALPELGPHITGLHFGSYALVVPPVADALAELARSHHTRFVSVDPNVRPTIEPDLDVWRTRVCEYASMADLLKISAEDLEFLYPGVTAEAKAVDWLDAGVALVVVTDGGRDVLAWTRGGDHLRRTPAELAPVDTVGAGDAFQSALLTGLAEAGDPKAVVAALGAHELESVVDFAVRAAAYTCTQRGATLPSRAQIVSD